MKEKTIVVTRYHMSYRLTRTSMALDDWTIQALKSLAERWGTSRAEILRRAVKRFKEESDREAAQPSPLEALEWLQQGGGLTVNEAEHFREQVQAEREAKRFWWEA